MFSDDAAIRIGPIKVIIGVWLLRSELERWSVKFLGDGLGSSFGVAGCREEALLVEVPPAPPPHAARPIMPNPTTHASTFLINTLALRISCPSYSLTEFNAFASFLAYAALWATPS